MNLVNDAATPPQDSPVAEISTEATDKPSTKGFVHLHVHTEFSPKDGISRLKTMVKHVVDSGMTAIAQTDHGTQGGSWKFHKACKDAGLKPIHGIEAYFALVPDGSDGNPALAWNDPQVRFARHARQSMDAETGKPKRSTYNHLTILARNEAGWRNLCAITNAANDSFYVKPLIDYALIKDHAEGLIVLSGCLGGPVASYVAAARTDVTDTDGNVTGVEWDETQLQAARDNLDHLIECVGRENVYVEVMDHGMKAEGWHHIAKLIELADAAGVKTVATNDSHYDTCEHAHAHDAWLASGQNVAGKPAVTLKTPDRWSFNGEGYWIRSEAEMRALFDDPRWAEACDNTVDLAERIEHDIIPIKKLRLPVFPVPAAVIAEWESGTESTFTDIEGTTHPARRHLVDGSERDYRTASAYHLHQLVLKGRAERYAGRDPEWCTGVLNPRIDFELGVIFGLGLEDYFLIVGDALGWARSDRGHATPEYPEGVPAIVDENGVRIQGKKPILVGPGRGSAAGSAVSYALKIVMVEPIDNGLLFERFLDTERVGMPDIDVDFETDRRNEIYGYLASRYGRDKIARIGAFQQSKSKSAIKDAARLVEKVALGNKLADAVPVVAGAPLPFKDLDNPLNEMTKDFRELEASEDGAREITDLARMFESVAKGESIHAAGVLIADEPLTTLLPMRYDRKSDSGVPIALWDGKDVDDFGMLKLDALALRNLDIVAACVENIERTLGITVDPDNLPDPDTKGDPKVAAAFHILREGKTGGVFQLESSGITDLCTQIAPTEFNDLSALVALYRPGPMGAGMHMLYADRKNGRAEVDYGIYSDVQAEQDIIESVLGDTWGTTAFQEQLMELSAKIAGFDAAHKNKLRKAFSKKDRPAMEALKAKFVDQGQQEMALPDGSTKIAFKKSTLEELWRTFDASAEYLFNKSHSAAYGYLSYVTAYLKANYGPEYAAALLANTENQERRIALLNTLKDDGMTVVAPDVNDSGFNTSPDIHDRYRILLGLGEVQSVKSNATFIVAERDARGPFTSMNDLRSRVTVVKEGKRSKFPSTSVEALVEAGAFDSFGPRLGHMVTVKAGDAVTEIPDLEWGPLEKAARQRSRLHFATGEHPVDTYLADIRAQKYSFKERGGQRTVKGADVGRTPVLLEEIAGETNTLFCWGLLTSWSEAQGKRGRFARYTIESSTMKMDGIIWPGELTELLKNQGTPTVGSLVILRGRAKSRTFAVAADESSDDTMDAEGGNDTVEQLITVTELTADKIRVIDVNDGDPTLVIPAPVQDGEGVATAPRPTLASMINLAKDKVAKFEADAAAAKEAERVARAAARAAEREADRARKEAEKEAQKAAAQAAKAAAALSGDVSTSDGEPNLFTADDEHVPDDACETASSAAASASSSSWSADDDDYGPDLDASFYDDYETGIDRGESAPRPAPTQPQRPSATAAAGQAKPSLKLVASQGAAPEPTSLPIPDLIAVIELTVGMYDIASIAGAYVEGTWKDASNNARLSGVEGLLFPRDGGDALSLSSLFSHSLSAGAGWAFKVQGSCRRKPHRQCSCATALGRGDADPCPCTEETCKNNCMLYRRRSVIVVPPGDRSNIGITSRIDVAALTDWQALLDVEDTVRRVLKEKAQWHYPFISVARIAGDVPEVDTTDGPPATGTGNEPDGESGAPTLRVVS